MIKNGSCTLIQSPKAESGEHRINFAKYHNTSTGSRKLDVMYQIHYYVKRKILIVIWNLLMNVKSNNFQFRQNNHK